jgi:hypothetical protein
VKQDPSTNKTDSKMNKSLEELSQILPTAGISASQEEKILTIVKNLVAYPDIIEEQEFHEPHPQEYLEASSNHLCQPVEETKKSWTTFDGEQPLEPEIEEFLTCLSEYPLCTQETNHLKEDDMHSMVEEDI